MRWAVVVFLFSFMIVPLLSVSDISSLEMEEAHREEFDAMDTDRNGELDSVMRNSALPSLSPPKTHTHTHTLIRTFKQ